MQRNFNILGPDFLRGFAKSYLDMKDRVSLSAVDKYLHESLTGRNAQLLWRFKLQQHFPDVFAKLTKQENVNWYQQFGNAYASHYRQLTPRQKWLVACIKEGDIKSLQQGYPEKASVGFFARGLRAIGFGGAPVRQPFGFDDFDTNFCFDHVTKEVVYVAVEQNNQGLLDYLYSIVLSSKSEIIDKDINASLDSNGMMLIHYAAAFNQSQDVLVALVERGANVNAALPNGFTAFHLAVWVGHLSVVKILLANGVSVNAARHSDGATALHVAAERDYLSVVKFLLACGANVNAIIQGGTTALHIAAQSGHLPVVEFLLALGANVNAQTDNGATALHAAAQNGHVAVVEFLLARGANVNAASYNGFIALHYAAENGHVAVVEKLLASGANVDVVNAFDRTALHAAAQNDHLTVVKVLLAHGANVDAANMDGYTALHAAAQRGHLPIVDVLLARGTNVNAANMDGYTALHAAASNGHLPVVEVLLARGTNVNTANRDGVTALHYAAWCGYDLIVALLLAYGANIYALNADNETPLSLALLFRNFKAALWLYVYEVNARHHNEVLSGGVSLFGLFQWKPIQFAIDEKLAASALLTACECDAADHQALLTPHLSALQNGRLGEIFRGLGFSTQWNGAVVRMQRP